MKIRPTPGGGMDVLDADGVFRAVSDSVVLLRGLADRFRLVSEIEADWKSGLFSDQEAMQEIAKIVHYKK
jgi:hypothetical protein